MVSEQRAEEVRTLLATLSEWAQRRPDVDVVLSSEDRAPRLEDEAWVYEMGGVGLVWTRGWGMVTERRFALPSGLDVELVVAPPSWAATDPVDEGTRRVVAEGVSEGVSVVYDPEGSLARLLDVCDRPVATGGSRGSGVGDA